MCNFAQQKVYDIGKSSDIMLKPLHSILLIIIAACTTILTACGDDDTVSTSSKSTTEATIPYVIDIWYLASDTIEAKFLDYLSNKVTEAGLGTVTQNGVFVKESKINDLKALLANMQEDHAVLDSICDAVSENYFSAYIYQDPNDILYSYEYSQGAQYKGRTYYGCGQAEGYKLIIGNEYTITEGNLKATLISPVDGEIPGSLQYGTSMCRFDSFERADDGDSKYFMIISFLYNTNYIEARCMLYKTEGTKVINIFFQTGEGDDIFYTDDY